MLTVEEVASAAGLTIKGSNAGPCPVCKAKQTSRSDKRPPLRFKDDDQWLCAAPSHGEQEPRSGGPITLARALHADNALDDDQLARFVDQHRASSGEVRNDVVGEDVGEGHGSEWARLIDEAQAWRERVREWARERQLGEAIALALEGTSDVAAVPVRQWPERCRAFIEGVRWAPRDLLIAIRRPDDTVVDIERRWVRGRGKPDEGPKTARLAATADDKAPRLTAHKGGVCFGRMQRAVLLGMRGEPIVLVEGSADFLGAEGACRVRGSGAALGALGATGLPKLAKALVRELVQAGARPGQVTVIIVPHVLDLGDQPRHRDYRIGERCAWNAAIQLCDIARVRWCPPSETRGDFCDAIAGAVDPVATAWRIFGDARPVLDSGRHFADGCLIMPERTVDLWQSANDRQIREAAFRLRLGDMLHFLHFRTAVDKEGYPYQKYEKTAPAGSFKSPERRIGEAVGAWMSAHGVRLVRDDEGSAWVWDPVEPADPPDDSPSHDRQIPRLFQVGGSYWGAWLQEVGWLNQASGDGKTVSAWLKDKAARAPKVPRRPWLSAEGTLAAPTVALHLHTRAEDLLIVDAAGARVEPNGRGTRLLMKEDEAPAIEWVTGIDEIEAGRLLWRLLGESLTVEAPLRSAMVAHALLAPLREIIGARPILFGTGAAGSGKSQFARQIAAWLTGEPDPDEMTVAAAWEASKMDPYLLFDNLEGRFLEGALEKFLLLASTGGRRRKFSTEGDRMVRQAPRSMIHVNAIGPPVTPEMLRRCLLIRHDRRHRLDSFSQVSHLEAVASSRSAIWSAIMRLYERRILPALAAGRHGEFARSVPQEHPIEGFREALGAMAVIQEALAHGEPAWGWNVWPQWLKLSQAEVEDSRAHTDPLRLALEELLFQMNRVVDNQWGRERPAVRDSLFVCQPIYVYARRPHDPIGPVEFTLDAANGVQMAGSKFSHCVGFQGQYVDLYRDLKVATRDAKAFTDVILSGKEVGANMGNVQGWSSAPVKRLAGGDRPRVYQWISQEHVDNLMGDEIGRATHDVR